MMKMFEKTGEFKPDSLIVSPDFPILKEGIGLKAGYGVLKRGSRVGIIRKEPRSRLRKGKATAPQLPTWK